MQNIRAALSTSSKAPRQCGIRFNFLGMRLNCFPEGFELYDPCLVADSPGDDLSGMFAIIRFDDGPAAVGAVVAAPFEVMQVTCRVDFPDDGVAVACLMR